MLLLMANRPRLRTGEVPTMILMAEIRECSHLSLFYLLERVLMDFCFSIRYVVFSAQACRTCGDELNLIFPQTIHSL